MLGDQPIRGPGEQGPERQKVADGASPCQRRRTPDHDDHTRDCAEGTGQLAPTRSLSDPPPGRRDDDRLERPDDDNGGHGGGLQCAQEERVVGGEAETAECAESERLRGGRAPADGDGGAEDQRADPQPVEGERDAGEGDDPDQGAAHTETRRPGGRGHDAERSSRGAPAPDPSRHPGMLPPGCSQWTVGRPRSRPVTVPVTELSAWPQRPAAGAGRDWGHHHFRPPPRRSRPMVRPRFTLTRIALAGAGLLTAAGIGAAAIPAALASTPAAAATSPSTVSPTPKTTPAAHAKGGAKARARHLGLQLRRLLVAQTAKQTGQTVEQVRAELRSGKSLDAIAGSKAQAVRDAVLDTITRRLDALRAKGTITQVQETEILARMQTRITKVMAAVPHHKGAAAA